jgi:hypothetical protein
MATQRTHLSQEISYKQKKNIVAFAKFWRIFMKPW